MRRIRLAGDCAEVSAIGSAGGVDLSLPVTLSDVDWPLPLWLASVDIGIDGLHRRSGARNFRKLIIAREAAKKHKLCGPLRISAASALK